MNPDRRFQLLQLSLARMSVLLRGTSEARLNDEQLLADFRNKVDSLQADLVVVRGESQQQRDHYKRQISQQKEMLQAAEAEIVSEHRRCQQMEAQATIKTAQARRWQEQYSLVDAERQDCEAEIHTLRQKLCDLAQPAITANEDRQEVWPISDVQVCPACSEQQLVHTGQDFYKCLYCECCFKLCMEKYKT